MLTFYPSSLAPINCEKQEREKKLNQSRKVKSCIAARQARHGLPASLIECTTVEWNFNQSHICQCPLAFQVLKAAVVVFASYCDQDGWREAGGLPLVDMSWFTAGYIMSYVQVIEMRWQLCTITGERGKRKWL
jgi:hypothetical protein